MFMMLSEMLKSRKNILIILLVQALLIIAILYFQGKNMTVMQQARQGQDTGDPTLSSVHVKPPLDSPAILVQGQSVKELKEVAKSIYNEIINAPINYNCSKPVYAEKANGWLYCKDTGLFQQKNCLIFSFGIQYNYRFDNHFAAAGCEVHSFDPSQDKEGGHHPRIQFYFIGLGGEDTDTFVPRLNLYVKKKTQWKMRTLKTLMRDLNHSNSMIDVLKMDIELSEWPVIRNMIDTNVLRFVKQLLVEWHIFKDAPPRETFPELLQSMKDLYAAGFRRFYRDQDVHQKVQLDWENLSFRCNVGYINTNLAPLNGTLYLPDV